MKKHFLIAPALACALTLAGAASNAATVFSLSVGEGSLFSTNSEPTGSSADLSFSFEQDGVDVDLKVDVTNTTGDTTFGAGATESRLMGFAFTTPSILALESFISSTIFPFLLTDDDSVNGGPFNSITFDFGAGNKSTLEGPGSPSSALAQGDSTSFTFRFQNEMEGALASAFEDGFADGSLELGLRFKAVNAGAGSDKILYRAPPPDGVVPLPAAGWLLLGGVLGLFGFRRRTQA